ncbi:MAG: hypothetical protein IJ234_06375 [Clostridia bacterium]|nr:hypothetical protein [Clostridia bacterium]
MRKLWIALMLIFALLLASASAYDSSFAFSSGEMDRLLNWLTILVILWKKILQCWKRQWEMIKRPDRQFQTFESTASQLVARWRWFAQNMTGRMRMEMKRLHMF